MTAPSRIAPVSKLSLGRRAIARGALLAALGLLVAPAAEAAQRVHFKNGHVLVVDNVREEGSTVYLTLRDGSEVGFPKALIAEFESGPNIQPKGSRMRSSSSVRGPSIQDLAQNPGNASRDRRRGTEVRDSGWTSERNPGYSGPATFGYGRFGSSRAAAANRPELEKVSMREARRIIERRRAPASIADPNNVGENTGPAIAAPKPAKARADGRGGSQKQ